MQQTLPSQSQIIVGRDIRTITKSLPLGPVIISIMIGIFLLAAGAIVQGRARLNAARTSYERTRASYLEAEAINRDLTNQINRVRHDKNTISRLAHEKLGYIAKNEIVVLVK